MDKLKKYFNSNNKAVVNIVFLFYSVFLILFVLTYILILKKDAVFFLNDDGYFSIGVSYFENKISLLHQYRSPGLILLYSFFNYLPSFFHPFLRLFLTLLFTYGNIYLVSRIFENLLNKKQMLIGLLCSVFNPVYIHFTIKNTPEIYLAFSVGLIIFFYKKYLKDFKIRYLIIIISVTCLSMAIKPVFFLIPAFLFIHIILIKKIKKLLIPVFTYFIFVLITFFMSSFFTKPLNQDINYFMIQSITVPTYLPSAIMQTKELNLGTTDEILSENKANSNFLICMDKYNNWLEGYQLKNNHYTEWELILDFIKDNFLMFFIVKLISPLTFISLSSTTAETITNFVLNTFLIVLCIRSIKLIYNSRKNDILVILTVIIGYSFAFFLSATYIRYSLPFIFYFFPFSGILLNRFIEIRIFKKKTPVSEMN